MSRAVDAVRLARALAIVAVSIIAVPVTGVLFERDGIDVPDIAKEGGVAAREIIGEGDPLLMIGRLEDVLAEGDEAFPEGFSEEIGMLPASRDIHVDAGAEIVGFVIDGAVSDVRDALETYMEGKGWTCVPLGGVEGATFVKEGGELRWVLATCTQVGDATSVVFQLCPR